MPRDAHILTGYYRYTDIWFEWSQVLPNPEDARPLKAILAHDAITHPDHPLHVDGVNGVQMYLGTFVTGESRLLFSSAQVDYVRYWLHTMQLTKEMIPLPYSDCLITESSLRGVSKVVYANGGSLRGAIKQIDKNNKRLKGSNPILQSRRLAFERIRTLWAAQRGIWCALDFEAYEYDHRLITELGYRFFGWRDGVEHQENGHFIVTEHQKFLNGKYVPEHRYDYGFGESEYIKKSVFPGRVGDFLTSLSTYGPVYLVFHDNSQDIKYLNSLNAPINGLSYILPDSLPDSGLFVVDTSDLFGALEGSPGADRRKLERMCNLMQIPTRNLHNAGNDAYYTLEAMMAMAGGDPVDIQREKRWPNHTTQGVKVEFKPFEEDSDYSDEEGLVPHGQIDSW